MLGWASVILSVVLAIPRAILNAPKWLWRRILLRPDISITVGEIFWHGLQPIQDDQEVKAVVIQVGITNSSGAPGSISMFRLDMKGFASYFPAQVEHRDHFDRVLSADGSYSLVPSREGWLQLPIHLEPWDSETGWVGFNVGSGAETKMTFGHARSAEGSLVATVAGKGEVSAAIRAHGGRGGWYLGVDRQ